ncbi:hypothetical protein GCM10019016_031800 [Streptomyces prasinosporus]|uniref:Integral membrane protein n=1 Tax=Streptomyces prasinosporus TaxID=68256 RepID=A0ABP6TLF5_9ACTN
MLLPLSGAALATDARLLERVRAIGARCGVDYTDDAAVTELLTERRRALERIRRGPLVQLGALALTAAVVWPFLAPTVPALTGDPVLSYAPAGPLLLVAVACLVLVHVRWKRALTQEALAGYREVLGVARAHGVEPAHVPAWLEGRTPGGSGKGAAPIPAYPDAAPLRADAVPPNGRTPAPSVPPKPETVTAYERIAGEGGWHDETGCLLVLAGAGGAIWAATSGTPLGYAALLLVPVAVAVWLAGRRQGVEKERLRAEAEAYVRAVAEARANGIPVPELSPALRELLDR